MSAPMPWDELRDRGETDERDRLAVRLTVEEEAALVDLDTLRLVWERRQFYASQDKPGVQNPSPRGDNPRLLDADELSARIPWPR